MRSKILILMLGFLLFAGGLAEAELVTIQITGNVTFASGSALPNTIYEGINFTGTYIYDSLGTDSDSSAQIGIYRYNSPYGINIALGGYEFTTPSNNVGRFGIRISNDRSFNLPVTDYYTVFSGFGENIFDSIIWELKDITHTALSSDALPVAAPALNDWDYNNLSIWAYDSSGYGPIMIIHGTVTQAVLIPEPITGVLMAMGALFLRRGR